LTSFFSNAHPIKLSTFNQAEPVPGNGESQNLNTGEIAIADQNQIHGGVNNSNEDAVFVSIYSAPQIGYEKTLF
jgi:hypothetical protein